MLEDVPEPFKSQNVALLLVANSLSGHVRRYGDGVAARRLVTSLFGTPSQIRATLASCAGQLTPRMWTQGRNHCILVIPREGLLVGFVLVDFPADVRAVFDLSKRLEREAQNIDWDTLAPVRVT